MASVVLPLFRTSSLVMLVTRTNTWCVSPQWKFWTMHSIWKKVWCSPSSSFSQAASISGRGSPLYIDGWSKVPSNLTGLHAGLRSFSAGAVQSRYFHAAYGFIYTPDESRVAYSMPNAKPDSFCPHLSATGDLTPTWLSKPGRTSCWRLLENQGWGFS